MINFTTTNSSGTDKRYYINKTSATPVTVGTVIQRSTLNENE